MRRQDAAFVVNQRDLGAVHLTFAQASTQLPHGLNNTEEATGGASVSM